MDKSGLEICICLDNKSKKVVGLFTEGDFRNAVHQGINLNNKVIKILNKRFHYVSSITKKSKIKNYFNKNVNCIPVIKKYEINRYHF